LVVNVKKDLAIYVELILQEEVKQGCVDVAI
jgi:hypothetical protein